MQRVLAPVATLSPDLRTFSKGDARNLAVSAETALNSGLFRLQTGTPWEIP